MSEGFEVDADTYDVVIADQIKAAISVAVNESARSQQGRNHVLGISDIGKCRQQTKYMIEQVPFSDAPGAYTMAAFVGTAVGALAEEAVIASFADPRIERQLEVRVEISPGITLIGHPDLVGSTWVLDFKTKDGLGLVRKSGATQQQRFQVSLYAAALIAAERLPQSPLCVLAWLDRSGADNDPHVVSWTYDEAILDEIREWVSDVIYAVENHEDASRDMPRVWCERACAFFTHCRGRDTDVQGLIEDEELLTAVKQYKESGAIIKEQEALKKEAQKALTGVAGSTGEFAVRWIEVGPSVIPEQTRAGYSRLSVTKVRNPTTRG